MSTRYFLTLIPIAFMSAACSRSEAPVAAPSQPAASAGAAQIFRCASGTQIDVTRSSPDSISVLYKGKTLAMRAEAADSGRYVGENMEWWADGSGEGTLGSLYARNANGTTGDVVEGCVENPRG